MKFKDIAARIDTDPAARAEVDQIKRELERQAVEKVADLFVARYAEAMWELAKP